MARIGDAGKGGGYTKVEVRERPDDHKRKADNDTNHNTGVRGPQHRPGSLAAHLEKLRKPDTTDETSSTTSTTTTTTVTTTTTGGPELVGCDFTVVKPDDNGLVVIKSFDDAANLVLNGAGSTLGSLNVSLPLEGDDIALLCEALQSVRSAKFEGCTFTPEAMQKLAELFVRTLQLQDCKGVDAELLKQLAAIPTLVNLAICHCGVTDSDLKALLDSTSLVKLRIEGELAVTDKFLAFLPPRLEDLTCTNTGVVGPNMSALQGIVATIS
ncbi:hypothetical protein [Ramlibacter sp.]|uniref:hypothetical protein n=1 Tax=Ramlibacter sp. TaxID=1917967 RepID=UPI003D1325FB